MDGLPRFRSAIGTIPPETEIEEAPAIETPSLDLTVRLDRPFHELKEYLLAEFERAYLLRCLGEAEMNVSLASRVSGLSRKHLRTLMAKYGIRRGDPLGETFGENDNDVA